jgi:phage-related minor tail protein
MTSSFFDPNSFQAELSGASAALNEFAQGPARRAADDIGASFERAGARIAASMARAAFGGETSFKRMAKTILEELAKIALNQAFGKGGGGSFFGARAAGGSVNAGGAYLVGERGPEWFTPASSGQISGAQAGAVNVHFHFGGGGDANSVVRHQGQIAAQVARAVAYGRRNL